MGHGKIMSESRREYGDLRLNEEDILDCPFRQFKAWFSDAATSEALDPTAMVLSTVDALGRPDSRVVLLKGLEEEAFVFYTNYLSTKSLQISNNAHVALNFYWPSMARQIRIRGQVHQTSKAQSDDYFASRPVSSQLSAIASPQSREVSGRNVLEKTLNQLIAKHQGAPIMRPTHWGGYAVIPDEMEFWQGRDNRLHDRIQYYRENQQWAHRRLAP